MVYFFCPRLYNKSNRPGHRPGKGDAAILITPGLLGLSYRTAPLDLRAQAAFSDRKKLDLAAALAREGVDQCAILATCNRTEIYYMYTQPHQPAAVRRAFLSACGQELEPHLYALEGKPALEQLFLVAAGLDSQILGEDQILGQLQQAAAFARATGSGGKELNRMLQNAAACAKAVKTAYPASQQPLSVCYIGIRQLESRFGLAGRTGAVLGSGQMARLALRHLSAAGLEKIYVCCRSPEAGAALEKEYPGLVQWQEFARRSQILPRCQVVVSATSAPHLVLQPEHLAQNSGPLALLDLAVPRDIDPALADRPDTVFLDVDSLKQTSAENLARRRQLAAQSRQMLDEAVEESWHWLAACAVDRPIQTLRQQVQQVESDTADLLCARLELSDRQQKLLRKLLHAGMNRLLRQPIRQLKELENEQDQARLAQAIDYLFNTAEE